VPLIYNQLINKLLVSTITLFSNPDLIFYHLNNIAYLFLFFYSYEILDNLMFPHIQMSINIDYLFSTLNSIF